MKKFGILFGILLLVTLVSVGEVILFSTHKKDNINTFTIVTSFYPMYIIAANLIDEMDGVEVVNLTESQTGCLHDYQLTTKDMKKLEGADVLVINGGGMENFLNKIMEAYPKLNVIDASQGISFLEGEERNAHVWLNPENYKVQIRNIAEGFIQCTGQGKKEFENNKAAYLKKVDEIIELMKQELADPVYKKAVVFHDAFAYLADFLNLQVVHCVNMDEEGGLSAGEIAEIVDEVKRENVKLLFTEEQFQNSVASQIGKETKASVYVIDSLVTGITDKNAYIDGMKRNIEVLKKALYEGG